MKKILIIGSGGMFGQDAVKFFRDSGYEVLAATRTDFDVTNFEQVQSFFQNNDFDFVINAAAYTKVDDAENEKNLAFLINSDAAKNIAKASNQKNVPVLYISTDYVFDGNKGDLYEVDDETNPATVYGASKLAGEKNTIAENPKYYIARTSWLYGKNGKNFVDSMIALSKNNKELKVVDDQFGCPTSTLNLARGIKKLIEENKPFGIYHICGSGVTTWYRFAKKIFEILKIEIDVKPVTTDQFPRPAKRPKFSAMNNSKICASWEDSLKEYLKN